MMNKHKRGEIWWCDLDGGRGFEEVKVRPVVIVQNDMGNTHSPMTTVVPITTKHDGSTLPTHYHFVLNSRQNTALIEQVRAIDCHRLQSKIEDMRPYDLDAVVECVIKNLGG